jgi:hypothetical protein
MQSTTQSQGTTGAGGSSSAREPAAAAPPSVIGNLNLVTGLRWPQQPDPGYAEALLRGVRALYECRCVRGGGGRVWVANEASDDIAVTVTATHPPTHPIHPPTHPRIHPPPPHPNPPTSATGEIFQRFYEADPPAVFLDPAGQLSPGIAFRGLAELFAPVPPTLARFDVLEADST